MNACIVIPFYNHAGAIAQVVEALKPLGLPCFIVDDGSDAEAQQVLEQIASQASWVKVQRLPENRGKGAAVMAGCDVALAAGFTHALQIDADGQHDAADAARLLEQARRQPSAVICGEAIYDSTVPRSRRYGRYLTHVWVWINTLSFEIRDSMCGLRVYPLAVTCAIWHESRVGQRMDFDVEIMVRLSWKGVRVIAFPTRVTYPQDGVSHFRMLEDNVYISRMHTRLFFGMLWRMPALLARRVFSPSIEGGRMTARSATVEIVVPFHDIDAAGLAWHGHYAKYFEIARCELLDSFNYGYGAMLESGFMWPVIDMRIRYVQSVRFDQRILVKATLREWENRLLIDYLISDQASAQRLTKGSTVQVAVDMKSGEMCFVSPPILFERLGLDP